MDKYEEKNVLDGLIDCVSGNIEGRPLMKIEPLLWPDGGKAVVFVLKNNQKFLLSIKEVFETVAYRDTPSTASYLP